LAAEGGALQSIAQRPKKPKASSVWVTVSAIAGGALKKTTAVTAARNFARTFSHRLGRFDFSVRRWRDKGGDGVAHGRIGR
jgi:hypothetical protein